MRFEQQKKQPPAYSKTTLPESLPENLPEPSGNLPELNVF